MWVIAGVLLGLVVLGSLIGFHAGPHAHVVAGSLGVLAAAWLVWMALEGRSAPVLWALLSADVVVSAGVGVLAWKGLSVRSVDGSKHHLTSLEGAEGVAVGDLDPNGIVRVNGETWSATAMNARCVWGLSCKCFMWTVCASRCGGMKPSQPARTAPTPRSRLRRITCGR